MMRKYSRLLILSVGLAGLILSACQKKWDEHNEITDEALKNNLYEHISADANLSLFASYLVKTGYDKEIASSKTYTVFAPVNAALQTLDPAIVNNAALLKKFVANHITNQSYYTARVIDSTRIVMLSGKYLNMKGTKIDDATITTADRYAANGVVQVIDKMMPVLNNCWEFLETNTAAPVKQSQFMLSLFQKVFDTTDAVITGVDPNTGAPIYQPGTDSVLTNLIWNRVYDLKKEDKQYTVFMFTDAAWDAEITKYKPYFVTGTADSTTYAASWAVVKDLIVEGVYTPATIPDTILSKFGTKIPVEKASIVQTIKTSNGIIYIMGKIDVQPKHKFRQYLIQAENYTTTSLDRRSNTYFRDRFNPMTGQDFRDLLVLNHGVALFNLQYSITEMPSVKYKAYWVALNDFQTATHTQKLGIGIPTSTTFGYTTVPLANYNEAYIGEFTNAAYRPVYSIYLTAANSTTNTANPITCDYIRLEPVL
jgi:uncharacterized surface protein with fasciclin (FAS1) repeats